FIYQNRLKAISDSLFNIEKIKNINTIETKLKVSEKEKTIALQRLDMQKNAADQEKSRKRIVMLVAGSSLLLLVLFFILYVFIKTKRQKKEVELQKNRAERLNILNQKIFAVIAHDFKSPMIALNMLMDLLDKENISKEDLSSYSADVRNQVIQSGQILDNLLNWAKTELKLSYDTNLKASPFLIAEEIIKELTFMSSRKNIRIINHIPPAIALKVPPDILRIILRNLLSNAVKFSYSDNAITTGYNNNIIFVADQGQGVQEKTLNELFSGTVQSKLGTFNETGFGLGLYITHELINKFQGKIWVENNNPSGTVFKFVLPVYE
ncbi:MAG TPA: HAMP domain-containing sensor histidine kinase, partial [Bacteroidia bacterium]|nr:HAMP domain-containing sensor histidine kinase [Bacteroidia bacterium]